jgi:hypothetical protein
MTPHNSVYHIDKADGTVDLAGSLFKAEGGHVSAPKHNRFFASPGKELDSDTAQLISGLEVSYIARMGVDPELFRIMTLKGKDEVTVVPHDMLRRYRISQTTSKVPSGAYKRQTASYTFA